MSKIERYNELYQVMSRLLNRSRKKVSQATNSTMASNYFEIGMLIGEEKQMSSFKTSSSKFLIENSSRELSQEFGRGFSTTNPKRMRGFYNYIFTRSVGV